MIRTASFSGVSGFYSNNQNNRDTKITGTKEKPTYVYGLLDKDGYGLLDKDLTNTNKEKNLRENRIDGSNLPNPEMGDISRNE